MVWWGGGGGGEMFCLFFTCGCGLPVWGASGTSPVSVSTLSPASLHTPTACTCRMYPVSVNKNNFSIFRHFFKRLADRNFGNIGNIAKKWSKKQDRILGGGLYFFCVSTNLLVAHRNVSMDTEMYM